ncbi:MAG TPA: hypothetical protein VH165_33360 [Kofleriaceae bacterium]|jgi:hypothetical protein|nr:hypothetical protein [Kofleriaceae bacterium]
MRTLITLLALVVGACSGSTPSENRVDSGRVCAGDLYDPCLSEHDCMSGVCQNFPGKNFQVCSKGCTPGMDDACGATRDSQAAMCATDTSVCTPPAANDCVIQ